MTIDVEIDFCGHISRAVFRDILNINISCGSTQPCQFCLITDDDIQIIDDNNNNIITN